MSFVFLDGLNIATARYWHDHGMVLIKGQPPAGQGQVAIGQFSNMKKRSHVTHVLMSSVIKQFTCNGLKSVLKW